MAKQSDYARYTIRIPGALYEAVARSAEHNGRSVNAEIIAALEEKFPALDPTDEFIDYLMSMPKEQRDKVVDAIMRKALAGRTDEPTRP